MSHRRRILFAITLLYTIAILYYSGREVLQEIHEKMLQVCARILEKVPDQRMEQLEKGIDLLLNAIKQTPFMHQW